MIDNSNGESIFSSQLDINDMSLRPEIYDHECTTFSEVKNGSENLTNVSFSGYDLDNNIISNKTRTESNKYFGSEDDAGNTNDQINGQNKKNFESDFVSLVMDEDFKSEETQRMVSSNLSVPSGSVRTGLKKKEPKYFSKPAKITSLFDQMRLKNIEDNQKFLSEIDLNSESSVLAPKPPKIAKVKKIIDVSNQPKRMSGRERKETKPYQTTVANVLYPSNGTLGAVSLSGNYDEFKALVQCLDHEHLICSKLTSYSANRIVENLAGMQLQKIGKGEKLIDANFHPGISKVLLAASDITGNVMFLDVGHNSEELDSNRDHKF